MKQLRVHLQSHLSESMLSQMTVKQLVNVVWSLGKLFEDLGLCTKTMHHILAMISQPLHYCCLLSDEWGKLMWVIGQYRVCYPGLIRALALRIHDPEL